MDLIEFFRVILIISLVFLPLERMLPLYPKQKLLRRGWQNDLMYLFLNNALVKLMLSALIVLTYLVARWVIPTSFHDAVADQPYWIQLIEAVILADFGFYWMHRLFHAIPYLWKFHAIHHSSEELDWLAGFRIHPIDQILTKGISLLPVVTLGFSEVVIGVYAILYQWQSVLLHANIRLKVGPLRWLVASPEFHRWHHSRAKEVRDKNFAVQLSFLDALFGTFHMPSNKLPTEYGIAESIPDRYIPQLLHPFRSEVLRPDRSIDANALCDQNLPMSNASCTRKLGT